MHCCDCGWNKDTFRCGKTHQNPEVQEESRFPSGRSQCWGGMKPLALLMDVLLLQVGGQRGQPLHTSSFRTSLQGLFEDRQIKRRTVGGSGRGKAVGRDESERWGNPATTWCVLVSLNLWVSWRREGMRRAVIFPSSGLFPSRHSIPIHFIAAPLLCTHLAFKSAAQKDKTRGVDGKVIHILLPPARSFTSAIICVYWKLGDKKKRRREKTSGRQKKKNNKRRQRRRSPVWINYILKNLPFASVSVQNLNKCQMPLCVRLFIVGGFLFLFFPSFS